MNDEIAQHWKSFWAMSMMFLPKINMDPGNQTIIFKKQSATRHEIAISGERTIILIYKGKETDHLNDLRLKSSHALH